LFVTADNCKVFIFVTTGNCKNFLFVTADNCKVFIFVTAGHCKAFVSVVTQLQWPVDTYMKTKLTPAVTNKMLQSPAVTNWKICEPVTMGEMKNMRAENILVDNFNRMRLLGEPRRR
jgi:hypothetical protein